MEESKVLVEVKLPNELMQKFLQYVRDFDIAHQGKLDINIGIDTQLTRQEVMDIMNSIVPNFDFKREVQKRQE